MRTPFTAVLVVVSLLLAGCGSLAKHMNEENSFLVSAEAVDVDGISGTCAKTSEADKRECIARMANDSRKKCKAFLDGLVLTENGTNTAFDMGTTLFSALATVFTPLSTVHGLTAGATISSGWKNAINSNIYAKASIANYQTAIMATYYKRINDYSDALPKISGTYLILANEAGKIVSIHAYCSLAAAQASIAATLQDATNGVETGEVLSTLTVTKPTVGETLTLSAISTVFSSGLVAVSHAVVAGDDEKKVADDLLKKVNEDASLKAAKITASAVSSPANSIVLRAPKSAQVQWQANNPKVIVIKAGAPSTEASSGTKAPVLPPPGQSLLKR